MLIWLVDLSEHLKFLNLFRYITFRTGAAVFTSAAIVFLFGPKIIFSLRVRQGKGQPIRADGPQTHFKTAGTPTMGGLMILAGIVGSSLLWADLSSIYVVSTLLVTLGFGAIGFYDDYLKVTKQSDKGFSGKARLGLEFIIAGIATYFMMHSALASSHGSTFGSSIAFPFFKDFLINLGIFFVLFGGFVIVAAGNAVNLTDGLDGLAIVPVMIAAGSFGVIAYLAGNAVFANYLQINFVPGTGELAVVLGAVIGAGLGFLWFNAPPAAVFMGETGSLALGGALGAITGSVIGNKTASCNNAPPPPPAYAETAPAPAYEGPPPPPAPTYSEGYYAPPPPPPPYERRVVWAYGHHGVRYRVVEERIGPDGCTFAEGPTIYDAYGRAGPSWVRVCPDYRGRYRVID